MTEVTDPARRLRIDADPETVEKGLATLVLTLVELLRQLMERQALRRVDDGSLSDEQIERIGATLMALDARMAELRDHFGVTPEDLNLDLGPLGPLLPHDQASSTCGSAPTITLLPGPEGLSPIRRWR